MAFKDFPYPSLTQFAYQGFDTASPNYTPAMMVFAASDGVQFVGRYLTGNYAVTRAECLNWLTAGIALYFYHEVNTDDAIKGYNYGYQQGKIVQAAIQNIGVPNGTMIFCCCDMDVTDAQARGVVADFFKGFRTAIPFHRVGIYGGANVMQAVKAAYPTAYLSQAGAWGYNKEFDPIDVRQWEFSDRCVPYIRVNNVSFTGNTYTWRGNSIDFNSAPTRSFMWYSKDQARPTPYTPPDDPPPLGQVTPLDGICSNGANRYHKLDECPEWSKPVLKKLLESGKLKGISHETQDLDLSFDMIRLLTIIYREGE